MDVVILLVAAALLVAGGFLAAFFWAVRDGQFDDLYTPSVRMLHGDHTDRDGNEPDNDNNHSRTSENL